MTPSEFLTDALHRAAEHAAGLPGEPVAVVAVVFTADGCASPYLATLDDALPMVLARLPEVIADALRELTVDQVRAEGDPNALRQAERIAGQAIQRAARR